MKKFLLYIIALLVPALVVAQTQQLFEIDANSFTPIQTDAISGVNIDKIGVDPSRRPCARIKMHINRMTREDIAGISVRPVGGSVVVTKQIVATEGNGLIVEMTAKAPTRFYLHHDKYGDSNEVSLNLEGDKEYRLNAQLNLLQSVAISSNVAGGEVYIDNVFKGRTDNNFSLTVNNLQHGIHKLRIEYGGIKSEQDIVVDSSNIHFRININHELAKPQYVVFQITPNNASVIIDGKSRIPDQYGYVQVVLNNGSYPYSISAKDYHSETGSLIVNGAKVEKTVSLRPAFGWLKIPNSGALQGASVYVNGELIGNAPIASYKLASGKYSVCIVKDLYKAYEGEVTISDNTTIEHAPSLVADFANVTLTSDDQSGIYVNNKFMGKGSWSGNLATGTYFFETRKDGCHPVSITQSISATPAKQSYTLSAPTPILGRININSTPAMADIYIDDKLVGKTPLMYDLIIGKHNIVVRKDGFTNKKYSITIEEDKTTDVNPTLVPKELTAREIREQKAKRRRELYAEKQKGFASMVDIAYNMVFLTPMTSIGVTYTAGYKFNNHLYLGAGTGLNYNLEGKVSESSVKSYYSNSLNPHAISIPIFAYFRANLINRRCSPFVALVAGGNLSPKQILRLDWLDVKYRTSGLFANPQIGLNLRTNTKNSLYFAVGLQCFTSPTCIQFTPYNAIVKPSFDYGIDFHLGFTF